jgi:hypothetical protein
MRLGLQQQPLRRLVPLAQCLQHQQQSAKPVFRPPACPLPRRPWQSCRGRSLTSEPSRGGVTVVTTTRLAESLLHHHYCRRRYRVIYRRMQHTRLVRLAPVTLPH